MEKKFRLPKDFAIKWIEALRSGEYKQGMVSLFKNDSYCCMVVAGRVCGMSKENIKINNGTFKAFNNPKVPEELITIGYTYTPLVRKLIHLNDEEEKSFNEIADWVEQNVEFYE